MTKRSKPSKAKSKRASKSVSLASQLSDELREIIGSDKYGGMTVDDLRGVLIDAANWLLWLDCLYQNGVPQEDAVYY